jgi:hypothetical protein
MDPIVAKRIDLFSYKMDFKPLDILIMDDGEGVFHFLKGQEELSLILQCMRNAKKQKPAQRRESELALISRLSKLAKSSLYNYRFYETMAEQSYLSTAEKTENKEKSVVASHIQIGALHLASRLLLSKGVTVPKEALQLLRRMLRQFLHERASGLFCVNYYPMLTLLLHFSYTPRSVLPILREKLSTAIDATPSHVEFLRSFFLSFFSLILGEEPPSFLPPEMRQAMESLKAKTLAENHLDDDTYWLRAQEKKTTYDYIAKNFELFRSIAILWVEKTQLSDDLISEKAFK